MLDTHYHVKKLQEVRFAEDQAEAIIELVVTNNKNFNERFDRLESYLEKKFDSIDTKIESIKSQILTWMGLGLAFIGVMITISTIYK